MIGLAPRLAYSPLRVRPNSEGIHQRAPAMMSIWSIPFV
jgi:hypothetical protein